MLGMGLFFMDRLTAGGMVGNGLAILSGVAFAGMLVFLRRQKEGFPLGSVFMGNVLTAVVCLPWVRDWQVSAGGWLALGMLGVFQLGLSYVLYCRAIRRVRALEAILIPMIEPILNPLWVFLFLGERPGPWALVGGAVVLGCAVWRSLRIARAKLS